MDHDRMDPRDRGMSGAEGPPPPPRTTNHRPSDNSRDRRSGKFFFNIENNFHWRSHQITQKNHTQFNFHRKYPVNNKNLY